MEEYETDRASQRANLIEQRMFELTLTSIDTLKHSTAVELRKAQNEMKKRLHRYRSRQREIVKSRPPSDKDPIEELMTRQMRNKAKSKRKRPQTCPAKVQTSKTRGAFDTDSDSDIEIDGSFMIDHQRSKIDLRPKTSMTMYRTGSTLDKYVRVGRLGPAVRQIRYFDEDELKDRGHFYMHLVGKRITEEKSKLNVLDDKVAEFCGTETIQTMHKKMQSKRKWFKRTPEKVDTNNNNNNSNSRTPGQLQTAIKNNIAHSKTRKTQIAKRPSSENFSNPPRPSTSSSSRDISRMHASRQTSISTPTKAQG